MTKEYDLKEEDWIPHYASEGAAGFDLRCAKDTTVGGTKVPALIPTGLKMAIPEGYELQVRPRSGLSLEGYSIPNSPGTIDSDYRGEIKVPMLYNGSKITIKRGERIAQAIVAPVLRGQFHPVGSLDETKRGSNGFGSTGK